MKRGRKSKHYMDTGESLMDFCKRTGISYKRLYFHMWSHSYSPEEALRKWKLMKETGKGERLSTDERVIDFCNRIGITKSTFFYMRSARRWTTDETAEYYKNKYSKRLTNRS